MVKNLKEMKSTSTYMFIKIFTYNPDLDLKKYVHLILQLNISNSVWELNHLQKHLLYSV